MRRSSRHWSRDFPAARGETTGDQGKSEGCRESRRETAVYCLYLPSPEPLGKGRGVWREGVRLSKGKGGGNRKYVVLVFVFWFLLRASILIGTKNNFSPSRVSLACDSNW